MSPEPYWSDDQVTLHLGDLRDILPGLAEASVDAIVCDPPYNLSVSSKRDTNCLRRILADVHFPDLDQRNGQIGQSLNLPRPASGSAELGGELGTVGVGARVGMPEGSVDFKNSPVVEHEVDTGNEASEGSPDGNLPSVADSELVKNLGDYSLKLADGGDTAFCDGTCSCFTEPGPGLIGVPVALSCATAGNLFGVDFGSPLGREGRSDQDVRLPDDAECEAKPPASVVAGAGAVVRAMLCLDLSRRAGELRLTDRAYQDRPLFLLASPEAIGAGAGTGGLTSMAEPGLVSLVGDSTDGAFSLHFPWHAVNSSAQGRGFMGKEWDGWESPAAFQRWCLNWARECMRVLKPGGYLVAFGSPRTYHRMTVGIEDAGFEIRDSLHWVYSTGMPKGQNIGKAIDRHRNDRPQILRVCAWLAAARDAAGWTGTRIDALFGTNGMASHWTAITSKAASVPTPEQWDVLRDALGFDDTDIRPLVAELNGRKGTLGEAWEQRQVIGERTSRPRLSEHLYGDFSGDTRITAHATEQAKHWDGWNTQLKPAHEPIVLARKSTGHNTTVANVLEHGTGALNIDACRTVAGQDYRDKCASVAGISSSNGDVYGEWTRVREDSAHVAGRWPTNFLLSHPPLLDDGQPVGDACAAGCVPGCPVAEMDGQSGVSVSRIGQPRRGAAGDGWGMTHTGAEYADSGGASRFFPVFRYEAKAPASERPRLANGTVHTTVKPLSLIRFLTRLVTPPGGLVLDPFAGSGTTGEAALIEGFRAVLVEKEQPHAELIKARLAKPLQPTLGFEDAS